MAAMRLTPWEQDRLQIFAAAELARRRRDRGLLLNHPEAVALLADAMLEAARDGAAYNQVEVAGRQALRADQVLPGVRELLDQVRVEVLVEDGARLVVLVDPLGDGGRPPPGGPGAVIPAQTAPSRRPARDGVTLSVRNDSRRAVRVSSHYPFERVNPRLVFDRTAAAGLHLDLPAGSSVRWGPGETHEVALVRYRGSAAE
jgi:urease subunit gamma/beta